MEPSYHSLYHAKKSHLEGNGGKYRTKFLKKQHKALLYIFIYLFLLLLIEGQVYRLAFTILSQTFEFAPHFACGKFLRRNTLGHLSL